MISEINISSKLLCFFKFKITFPNPYTVPKEIEHYQNYDCHFLCPFEANPKAARDSVNVFIFKHI